MREHTTKSGTYRIMEMPAMTAFHVTRRILPALGGLTGLASVKDSVLEVLETRQPAADAGTPSVDIFADKLNVLVGSLQPLFEILANLPDKDVEYVINTCLAYVRKVDGQSTQAVFNVQAQKLQYSNLKMPEMLELAAMVIMENAADFFPAKA